MSAPKLILDSIYEHEASRPLHVIMTQPVGGGQVLDYTWRQTMDQARRMAAHLQSCGFEPGARVAILCKNTAHFMMAELAIWMAGFTTVAIFPTEKAETVRFVLEHSGASLLFIGKLDAWVKQAGAVPLGLPCIAMPLAPKTDFETWDAVIERTRPLEGRPARDANDLAMLLYTSGSTGQPKGVMVNFKGVTEVAQGMDNFLQSEMGEHYEFRVLSYLPLVHCFERAWIECTGFLVGRAHFFFADSLDTFLQDVQRARPTIFQSVPRLWLKFQQGVFTKMPQARLDLLLRIPVLGKIVARKVLKGLGLDHVRLAASGSAPVPPALISWYRSLGLKLLEGYAMTEDFAYSHSSNKHFNAPGYVGVPLPGVKVRISDEGEILIKSPGTLVGYYKRPDLDAESFTPDGFFRTGDLGELGPDGQLKLTGRKKEMFKTGKGEYVAPSPIENLINADPMVEISLVSGVGRQAAYAMVVLAEQIRPQLADPVVRAEVEAELAKLLNEVNASLPAYERLRMIVVAREPWSIENGFLTPTMKVKRNRIEAAVATQQDTWYHQDGPVLWA